MNPTLATAADILPGILRNAIPKPSGPGYLLELEGSELDALRELATELLEWKSRHPSANCQIVDAGLSKWRSERPTR